MNKADEKETKPNFAFIAMPMDKDDHQLVDVLETIKEAAQTCGVVAERVDDTESNERITDRMLKSIDRAEYVIADLTKEKPNVFFEAGYAEGRGKTPIYIARQRTPLHFDTKDYPVIFFHNMKELREGLQKRFAALSASKLNSDLGAGASIAAESPQNDRDRSFFSGPPPIVAFSDRFSHAFPGVRGIAWFDDGPTIAKRLTVLLRTPLHSEVAWWWRGSKSMYIRGFEYIKDSHFLMGSYELNIRRIAAVNQLDYYQKFVYVETNADEPTGLYPDHAKYIDHLIKDYGYADEEYGLVDDKLFITRQEYDDKATIIDGEPVDVSDRVMLRRRYITPYNFIIAPQQSPINNHDSDKELELYLNDLVQGKDVFDDMCNAICRLPKRN